MTHLDPRETPMIILHALFLALVLTTGPTGTEGVRSFEAHPQDGSAGYFPEFPRGDPKDPWRFPPVPRPSPRPWPLPFPPDGPSTDPTPRPLPPWWPDSIRS